MSSTMVPAQAPNGKGQVPQLAPHAFLRATKAKRQKLLQMTPGFVENGKTTFQLPQAGLANKGWFYIRIPITIAGTVTGGTWATLPDAAPYCAVRRLRFYNNSSYALIDLSGTEWYLWMRKRYGYDPYSGGQGQQLSADVGANFAGYNFTSVGAIKPGAAIATGTFFAVIALPMDIAYNWAGDTGLIVLPTENVYYWVDLSWGTIATGIGATGGSSDLIKSLTGSGLSVTVGTPTIQAELDYFMIPKGSAGRLKNFVNLFMAVGSQVQNIAQTGQQTIQLPPNDYYMDVAIHTVANGLPIPAANLSNAQWIYGGQVTDYIDDQLVMQTREAWLSGILPIDGCIHYDLGTRLSNYRKRDTYDGFNDQSVTGLMIQYNIAAGQNVTAPAQMNIITEVLRPVDQPY